MFEQLFSLLTLHCRVLVSRQLLVLEDGQLLFKLANTRRLIRCLHHGARAVLEFTGTFFKRIDLDAFLFTFFDNFICLLLHLFNVKLQLLLETNVLTDVRLQLYQQLLVPLSLFGKGPIDVCPVHGGARIG